jgi:2-keto-3-deoxy-L-rhamnonate aldolase RhmA
VVQIESREAVKHAEEILGTSSVGVGLPGQKNLRASYECDEAAVQAAVLKVLAVSDSVGVPCGVTAGVSDVEERLRQGFRLVIATEQDAVGVGRRVAAARP